MPQPAEVDQLADPTVQAYTTAWDRILGEQTQILSDPFRYSRARALEEKRRAIEAILAGLDDEDAVQFTSNVLPQVYQFGATSGGGGLGEFTWTQIHQQAVQTLAQSAWSDLLNATQGVRDSTKELIRTVARDEGLQAAIEGKTTQQAAREMARILRENGIHAIRYADGSKHGLGEYAEMTQRTKSAVAYNLGTVNGSTAQFYEIFDGPDCGLSFHEDPTLANGLIVTRDESFKYVIAHPNCRRAFGPRPDLTALPGDRRAPSVTEEQVAAQRAADRLRAERGARRRQNRVEQRTSRLQSRQSQVGSALAAPPVEDLGELFRFGERPVGIPYDEWKRVFDSYTPEQRQWLNKWSDSSLGLNTSLREGRKLTPKYRSIADNVESAAAPLDRDLQVWRGVPPGDWDLAFDPGFLATSADPAITAEFMRSAATKGINAGLPPDGILIRYDLPKGFPATYGAIPGEVILPRGTHWEEYGRATGLYNGERLPNEVRLMRPVADARVIERVAPVVGGGRVEELKRLIAEQEAALKRAPGGGARARIKRKLEPLRTELEKLQKAEPEPKPKPEPELIKPKPIPPKPELPDFLKDVDQVKLDAVQTNEEIRKAHFGWTSAVAEKERLRQIEGALPTNEEIRKLHPGWTRARADKQLDAIREHYGLPPVDKAKKLDPSPVKLKPVKKDTIPVRDFKPDETIRGIKTENVETQLKSAQNTKRLLEKELAENKDPLLVDDYHRQIANVDLRIRQLQYELDLRAKEAAGKTDRFTTGPIEERIAKVRAKYEKEFSPAGAQTLKIDRWGKDYLKGAGERYEEWRDDWTGEGKMFDSLGRPRPEIDRNVLNEALTDLANRADTETVHYYRDLRDEFIVQGRYSTKALNNKAVDEFLKLPPERQLTRVDRIRLFGKAEQVAEKVGIGQVPKAVDWYQTHLAREVAAEWDRGTTAELNRTGRAFYNQQRNSVSLGTSGHNGSFGTSVHEFGHALENNVRARKTGNNSIFAVKSDTQSDARKFLNYRAQKSRGDKSELTEIYRNSGEYGYKDEFISHYMGKDYPTDTEIVSMGMEYLATKPAEFLAKDPEYFWFMVGILRGDL